MNRPLLLLAGLAALLPLAGCGGSAPVAIAGAEPVAEAPRAVNFNVVVRGAADMNRGNAVVARVYTLRSTSALQSATLQEVWADESTLGSAVVSSEEVRLFPGDEQRVRLEVGPGVTAIAVVANLRTPAGRGWSHVFPVADLHGAEAAVTIGADRVSAAGQ